MKFNLRTWQVILPTILLFCSLNSFAESEQNLPDPLAAGWKGKPVCEKLHEDNQQRILRCSFPPGVGHEKHYHAPHFGYALSGGKMRLTDAKGVREVELKTGSSYYSNGTDWHQVLNIGDTEVIYLIIEAKQSQASNKSLSKIKQ